MGERRWMLSVFLLFKKVIHQSFTIFLFVHKPFLFRTSNFKLKELRENLYRLPASMCLDDEFLINTCGVSDDFKQVNTRGQVTGWYS